jgi:hypothetical protein
MPRAIVPLADVDQRIPEAGRIRLGVKTAKGMTSIDTLRFTSPHRQSIEHLARLFGGTAQAWNDPKASPSHQFEVISQTNEIEVYLPREAITVWYELWSGGGVTRRCDGETCQVPRKAGDGWDMFDVECLCAQQNQLACRPYTRMRLILPQIPFRGVWRLETKGWNASKELPGMAAVIDHLAAGGQMVRAQLGVERRTQQTPAGKRNFVMAVVLEY